MGSLGRGGTSPLGEELDTARRYRLHAEELRTIATDRTMHQSRESLLRIAADYEHMAQTLEAIDRTNQTLSSRPPPDDLDPHFHPRDVQEQKPHGPRLRG
jgi:hypothetical protein